MSNNFPTIASEIHFLKERKCQAKERMETKKFEAEKEAFGWYQNLIGFAFAQYNLIGCPDYLEFAIDALNELKETSEKTGLPLFGSRAIIETLYKKKNILVAAQEYISSTQYTAHMLNQVQRQAPKHPLSRLSPYLLNYIVSLTQKGPVQNDLSALNIASHNFERPSTLLLRYESRFKLAQAIRNIDYDVLTTQSTMKALVKTKKNIEQVCLSIKEAINAEKDINSNKKFNELFQSIQKRIKVSFRKKILELNKNFKKINDSNIDSLLESQTIESLIEEKYNIEALILAKIDDTEANDYSNQSSLQEKLKLVKKHSDERGYNLILLSISKIMDAYVLQIQSKKKPEELEEYNKEITIKFAEIEKDINWLFNNDIDTKECSQVLTSAKNKVKHAFHSRNEYLQISATFVNLEHKIAAIDPIKLGQTPQHVLVAEKQKLLDECTLVELEINTILFPEIKQPLQEQLDKKREFIQFEFKLHAQIHAFKKIYNSLVAGQTSFFKTSRDVSTFTARDTDAIKSYVLNNPKSRSAIAWALAEKHFANAHVTNIKLFTAIHKYSFNQSSTLGLFKKIGRAHV